MNIHFAAVISNRLLFMNCKIGKYSLDGIPHDLIKMEWFML